MEIYNGDYETATATCQMVPLSEGLWHPLFICDPSCFVVIREVHSRSQLPQRPCWSSLTGSLLNKQIESLAANRYGHGDVDAASFSQHVTQVHHTCCCLFSPLQLQVCFRLSGGIIPRWSHLILMFCLYCVCCLIMPLALQVNRTDVSIGAPGCWLRSPRALVLMVSLPADCFLIDALVYHAAIACSIHFCALTFTGLVALDRAPLRQGLLETFVFIVCLLVVSLLYCQIMSVHWFVAPR